MSRREKDDERMERKQLKIDSGLLSERYPDVSSVVISMNYYQRNAGTVLMQRTVNFFPGSAAYFLMECMRRDCIDGGYNLEPVVTTMTKDRLEAGNGELVCSGDNPPSHARINYTIAINYSS
jgi:hypothetical protein